MANVQTSENGTKLAHQHWAIKFCTLIDLDRDELLLTRPFKKILAWREFSI
jgi:hypothetical protein